MENHQSLQELESKTNEILKSPKNHGKIELLVIRPVSNERKVVEEMQVTHEDGVLGDVWKTKPSSSTPDGKPHPEKQVTIMNSRCIRTLAGDKNNWPPAGDQIYVDLDLSTQNIPAGTELKIGTAVLKVSSSPHNGCKKFAQRFGQDSMRFVNSKMGKANRFRGLNAYVLKEGTISAHDSVEILE